MGTTVTRSDKQAARQDVKLALRKLTPEHMQYESAAIAQHVLGLAPYLSAAHVGCYVHCSQLREVDTTAILTHALGQDKRVFVPLVEDSNSNMRMLHLDDMQSLVEVPPFGIREPTKQYPDGGPRLDVTSAPYPLDVLIMPGLAFDGKGRRLGRGGGYYDKFLERYAAHCAAKGWPQPLLVALAYQPQMLPEVPTDPSDVAVDVIVSAAGVAACSTRGELHIEVMGESS